MLTGDYLDTAVRVFMAAMVGAIVLLVWKMHREDNP